MCGLRHKLLPGRNKETKILFIFMQVSKYGYPYMIDLGEGWSIDKEKTAHWSSIEFWIVLHHRKCNKHVEPSSFTIGHKMSYSHDIIIYHPDKIRSMHCKNCYVKPPKEFPYDKVKILLEAEALANIEIHI